MTDQPITYKSPQVSLSDVPTRLETSTTNGVKCVWRGNRIRANGYCTGLTLSWDFDWSVLKSDGVNRLSGHIMVTSPGGYFPARKIEINMTEDIRNVETNFQIGSFGFPYSVTFEYSLIPHRSPNRLVSYHEMFQPSENNDAILVIDEKKFHVNKAFLSFHSSFFGALFSSNFKEGQMDEIPIKDVSYEDFELLMSTIYPKTVYPNDQTVEKLLELGDRFMIPAVIGHVEHHLLHHSNINNEKMLWMADAYRMPKLLEKSIRELNTIEKIKKLKASPEYKKLSKDAICSIFERIMELI